ncbi:hypothetical protein IM774_06745 [Erysipelotrichaceae bacterium RD49]|nr:hypothetical protein [Erysipelotrichaceae bacterium RD49]
MNKRKVIMLAFGVLCLGVGVGLFRYSSAGSDPFSAMALGFQSLTGLPFGTCTMLWNAMLFIPVWFLDRRQIGLGTIFNMCFCGYISDFMLSVLDAFGPSTFATRMIGLAAGVIIVSFGLAMYMIPEGGVAPYDALAVIMEKRSQGRFSYRVCRTLTDGLCIVMAVGFVLISGTGSFAMIGAGTLICMFMLGVLAQQFRTMIETYMNTAKIA